MNKCNNHPDYELKYFCVDACCQQQTKICCADCQIEGPHRKHDFKNINVFKNVLGDISTQCSEYLLKQVQPEKLIEQVKEEFEYLRIFINESLDKMQSNCIQFIHLSKTDLQFKENNDEDEKQNLKQASEWQVQIDQLNNLARDCVKSGNEYLNNFDQSFLFNLYNKKEQLFTHLIQKQSIPLKQISSIKVSIINQMQEIQYKLKEKLSLSDQPFDILQSSFDLSSFQSKLIKESTIKIQDGFLNKEESSLKVRLLKNYDENNILIAFSDNIIRICNKINLEIKKEFKGHNWLINEVIILNQKTSESYSQQDFNTSDQLISCSSDTTIKLWNVKDQTVLQNIKSHYLEVTSIIFFNNSSLLSAGKDSIIFFYEIAYEQQQIDDIQDISDVDKQNNLQGENNKSKQIISKINQVYELKYLQFPVKQIEKINDVFFAVGYTNGMLALANFEQKQFMYCFDDKHELGLYCLARIDEFTFCSSGGDSKIKVWNLNNLHAIAEYKLPQQEYINKIKVLRKNKYIAISHSNEIDLISYQGSQLIDKSNRDQQNKKIPAFAQQTTLLRVLKIKLKNQFEITDFFFDHIKLNEENQQQAIVIGMNQPKLFYYS